MAGTTIPQGAPARGEPLEYVTVDGCLYRFVARLSDLESRADEARDEPPRAVPSAWMSVGEIVEYTGKTAHSVYLAMREGLLAYSVPSGCSRPRRSHVDDVDRWMGWRK